MKNIKMLHNLKISHRIFLITAAGGLLFLLLGAGYFYSVASSVAVKSSEQRFSQIDRVANQLKVTVLAMDKEEQQYLRSPTPELVTTISEKEALIDQKIQELRTVIGKGELIANIDSIEAQLSERKALFANVVAIKTELGLTADEGLRGSLRDAVSVAETELQRANQDVLTVKVLMMRKHEKDFVITGDTSFLGSRLNHNQKATSVARATADRKLVASLS